MVVTLGRKFLRSMHCLLVVLVSVSLSVIHSFLLDPLVTDHLLLTCPCVPC